MRRILKILAFGILLPAVLSCERMEVPLNVTMTQGFWKASNDAFMVEICCDDDTGYVCTFWERNGGGKDSTPGDTYALAVKDPRSLVSSDPDAGLVFTLSGTDRLLMSRTFAPDRTPVEVLLSRTDVEFSIKSVGQEVVTIDFSEFDN